MNKKLMLFMTTFCVCIASMAQSLDDIKKYALIRQYAKAKDAVDKFLAVPANAKNGEALYYKAYLYNNAAKEPQALPADAYKLNSSSFEALKMYKDLNPKAPLLVDENNSTAYNNYYTFYDLALKAYNLKNYDESYRDFKDALIVHDYVYNNKMDGPNGLKFSAHDTDIVWNSYILSRELKKEDDAFELSKRIANANLTDTKYLEVYENIVEHYKKANDAANFQKYIAIGQKLYPKEGYWNDVDIEFSQNGLKDEALFAKNDELVTKYPKNYFLLYNYSAELIRYIFTDEAKKSSNFVAYKAKIPGLLTQLIEANPTPESNALAANFFYNNYFDISDAARAIKGVTPVDKKKKADLEAAAKASVNNSIGYANTAVKTYSEQKELKQMAKISYKNALDVLIAGYKFQNNLAKAAEFQKQKDGLK